MNYPNILLAEDDEDDQRFFLDALQELNPHVQCTVANNGVEVFNILLLKPPPPSLIFLDLNMPLMNGIECLNKLKATEIYRQIPVVILTTSNNRIHKEETEKLGADQYLIKANSFLALKEDLRKVIQNKLGCISS
ncbi:MAG: response regulator [Bacteroidota bacterium]